MKTLLSLIIAFMVFCCPLHAQSTQLTAHQIFSTMPHRSPLPWGVLVVALAADVVTTQQAMHRGCHEGNNTMYGTHPSMGLLIGTHAAFAGGTYYWRDSRTLYAFAALFTAAAIHNATIRC